MVIGGIKSSNLKSPTSKIAVLPILSPDQYIINLDKVMIGQAEISPSINALVDTGNTLISFGSLYKDDVMQALQKNGGLTCKLLQEVNGVFFQMKCYIPKLEAVPDLKIVANGVTIIIKGRLLAQKCESSLFGFGDLYCLMNFEFSSNNEYMVLGKAFIMNSYTTFFLDRREIWISNPQEDKFTNFGILGSGIFWMVVLIGLQVIFF